MKPLLGVLAVIRTAHAEVGHPEELLLGELASLQDRAELQLTSSADTQREATLALEYGITRRLQVAVETSQAGELELAALVGAIRRDHVALALGASASLAGEVVPMASLLLGGRRGGINLAIAERASAAVFARLARVTPVLEVGYGEELAWRGGIAVKLGPFELGSAIGYGSTSGASVHATLTWELALAGEDEP